MRIPLPTTRDTSSQRSSDAWRLAAWAIALATFAALLLPFAAQVGFTGFMADDALYVLLVDALSPAHADDPLLLYVRQVAHLPPLYPALLALAGAGSEALARAHLVQGLLVLVALAAQAAYVRLLSGSDRLGLLVLAVLAALPATWLLASELWSEFLYLALTGIALACARQAAVTPRWWYWAAALAGLAAITRGVGLALIGALVIGAFVRRRRALPGILALAALPLVVARLAGQGSPGDYVEVFSGRVADLARLPAVVITNIAAAGPGWAAVFQDHPATPAMLLAVLVALLALLGAWPRLRRLEPDAVYVTLYLGLVAVWPFPDFMTRFLYPLVPLVLLYFACGLRTCAARALPRMATERTLAVASVGLVVLFIAVACWSSPLAQRYFAPPPGPLTTYRTSRYWLSPPAPARALDDLASKHAMTTFMRDLPRLVGPRECIHARHPAAVMLHAHRLAFPAPAGTARPSRPTCRFHLVLADRALDAVRADLWPGHQVLAESRLAGHPVAQLLRYDD
ncbi:MAG: hypothetical protein AB7Q81_10060 [Gammaproteobacteria bacterium]